MNRWFFSFFGVVFFLTGILHSADGDNSKVVWDAKLFADVHEVNRGDVLKGKTRMSGDEMKEFNLKVISVMLQNVGEHSILAEIEDELFYETGVLAGMSGSPVYFDGRLVGAVAFTVPNLKKPIVGITSIRSMFRVQKYLDDQTEPKSETQSDEAKPEAAPSASSLVFSSEPASGSGHAPLSFVRSYSDYGDYEDNRDSRDEQLFAKIPAKVLAGRNFFQNSFNQSLVKNQITARGFERQQISLTFPNSKNFNHSKSFNQASASRHQTQANQLVRIKTPLSVNVGLNNQRFVNRFFAAVSASSTASSLANGDASLFVFPSGSGIHTGTTGLSKEEFSKKASSLEPGDLIGVNLIRGDIDISAYGTVTYVKDDLIFAFGHAMDLAGKTDLPLYKAYVDGVVPRTEISYKVGSLIKEIGVINQDRSTAIAGRLGPTAKRIPVDLRLATKDNDRSFSFEAVNNRLYTPWLVPFLAFSTLYQYEGVGETASFSYKVSIEGQRLQQDNGVSKTPATPWKIDMEDTVVSYQSFEQNVLSFAIKAGSVFEALYGTQYGNLDIKKVTMEIGKQPLDYLFLEGVSMEKEVYKKGEPIKITAFFRSYKKKQVEKKVIHYQPPANLRPGVHRLNFSSESEFFWRDFNNYPNKYLSYDFPSFLKFFSQKQRNDRLVISVVSRNPAVKTTGGPTYRRLPFIAGMKLARLPSSKKDIFGDYYVYGEDFPLPILGSQMVVVEIVE